MVIYVYQYIYTRIMKFTKVVQIMVSFSFAAVSHAVIIIFPENTTTIYNETATLKCIVDEIGPTYEWADGDIIIYAMDFRGDKNRVPGTEDKYVDFSIVQSDPLDFSLVISKVQINYEGIYNCRQAGLNEDNIADLKVEAKVRPVTVTCQSPCDIVVEGNITVAVESDCQCTCNAIGGYPDSLVLQWNKGSAATQTEAVSTVTGPLETFDFLRNVTITTTKNYSPLKCEVIGYTVDSIKDSDDIEDQVSFNILYPPECAIIKGNEARCNGVVLICSCMSNPSVLHFSFYKNGEVVSNYTTSNMITESFVEDGETVIFKCAGYNTINNEARKGESPDFEYDECKTSTTATMTPEQKTVPTTTVNGLSTGAKIGISVAVVLLVAAVCAVVVYCIFFRGPSTSSKGNNSVRDGESDIVPANNEETNSSAPLYGVVNKDKKKKSDDNTDGNGKNSTNSDPPEYAAVSKPLKTAEPKAAPRSSAPSAGGEPEKMELQYADLDHGNKGPSFEIHQPADAPTEYATVQSVIV